MTTTTNLGSRSAPAGKKTQGQVKRSQTQKKKDGKRPVNEASGSESGNESGDGSGSGSPVIAKKAKKKTPSKIYTYNDYYKMFRAVKFLPTKYPDHKLLSDLGIHADVHQIFKNIGLGNFFSMEYPAYEIPTCQFLASLTVHVNPISPAMVTNETLGHINFQVGGKSFQVKFCELDAIFGFPGGIDLYLPLGKIEQRDVWRTIVVGDYKQGVSKGSDIRNPAIRYAHKVLAHTLFARQETARVKSQEMSLIIDGIKPTLQKCESGKTIQGRVSDVSYAFTLARQLLYYKRTWVKTSKPSSQLSIGGLVTPILLFCKVKLGGRAEEPTRIDLAYLSKSDFLVGRCGSSYAYSYHVSPREQRKLLLPNKDVTTLVSRDNVIFLPREDVLYNARIHPPLDPIFDRKTKKDAMGPPSDALPSPRVIGSARYNFLPYDGPIQSKALRHAHNSINLLQRFVKWQGRSIENLVKKVMSLDGEVKSLKGKVNGGNSSCYEDEEVADTEDVEDRVDEMNIDARHSYHEPSSSHMQHNEQPHTSSYERGAKRKRRAIRSPTPSSSNPPWSLDQMESSFDSTPHN